MPFIKTESDGASSVTSRHGCDAAKCGPGAFHAASINGCPRPAPRSETLTGPRRQKQSSRRIIGQQDQAGPSQLRTAATAIARLDRTHCQDSPIPAEQAKDCAPSSSTSALMHGCCAQDSRSSMTNHPIATHASTSPLRDLKQQLMLTLVNKPPKKLDSRVPDFAGSRTLDAAQGETFEIEDPALGTSINRISAAGAKDVDRAAIAARQAFVGRAVYLCVLCG